MNVVHAHIDFACRLIGKIRIDDTLVESEFTTVGGNAEHIVNRRVNCSCVNFSGSFGKLLHHSLLDFGGLCHFVVIDCFRRWEVELVGGFDVCRFFEQVHKLRQIKELCKTSSRTVACTLRCKLNGGRGLAKSRSPAVKVRQALVADSVVLQVSHHRVKLRHGVADRCPRCEYNASAVSQLVDVAALQEHIGGLLCIGSRKPCHISHFRVEEQVLKTVCFVHIETVNAELFKGDNIVLAGVVLQFAESCFQAFFRPLQRLDCEAFRTARFEFLQTFLDFRNLFLQKSLLPFLRYRDTLKLAVSDDDGVVVAGGNSAAELLAVSRLKVLFGCGKNIGRGV